MPKTLMIFTAVILAVMRQVTKIAVTTTNASEYPPPPCSRTFFTKAQDTREASRLLAKWSSFLEEEHLDAHEDEHDREYDGKRFSRQEGREAAPDQDSGNAADGESEGERKVHVAVGHLRKPCNQREDGGVGNVGAHDHRRTHGIEQQKYDGHDAPGTDGSEPHQVSTGCPEDNGEYPALCAHGALPVPFDLPALRPLLRHEGAEDERCSDQNQGRRYDGDHGALHLAGVEGSLHPLEGLHPEEAGGDAPETEEDGHLQVYRALPVVLRRSDELRDRGVDHVGPDGRGSGDSHARDQERRHDRAAPDPGQSYQETDKKPE